MKLLKKNLYKIFLLFFSKIYYKIILKKKLINFRFQNKIPNDAAIIFYPHAIGDVFNISLFMDEFKKTNNYDTVFLCTKNYIKALKKLIIKLGVDEVVSFDSNFYTHLKLAGLVHDYKNRIFIINHIFLHEKRRKSITFLEYFSILLSLDLKKDEITALFRKKYLSMNNMNKSKQIKKAVLFPYPGTLEVVDEKYWIDVVKVLKSNSIDVFTNIINNKQKVIDGSEGLSLKLNEIVDFVDEKTLIVARRNGLNDLFAFSSCKQLVIYMNSGINEHKRYGMSDIYSRLNRENSLHEVIIRKEYCGESAQEVLTKVLDLLTEERTSNEDIDY